MNCIRHRNIIRHNGKADEKNMKTASSSSRVIKSKHINSHIFYCFFFVCFVLIFYSSSQYVQLMFVTYCCSSYWLVGMSRYLLYCVFVTHILSSKSVCLSVSQLVSASVCLSVVVLYWILRYFPIRFVPRIAEYW